jgi:hypothetical protein
MIKKYPELNDRPNLGKNQMMGKIGEKPENFLLWDGNPRMQKGNK